MKNISERIAERKDEERQERVTRILTAARKVFFQKGFLGSTMRDIALEAALSPGLIYHYYEGKDALYGVICEEGFHALLSSLHKAEMSPGNPMERLTAVARAYVGFYEEYPEYFDIISFRDLGFKRVELSPHIREKLDNLSYQALDVIRRLIKEGVAEGLIPAGENLWDMAMMVWAPIEGLIFIHKRGYMDTFGLDFQKILESELRLVFTGIKR
jgi:AcrR family transcriptional regulator